MNVVGLFRMVVIALFVIKGCHCSCADSSKVATMCRDNSVSGTQVFIDTDLAGTLVLPSGVACTCQVATQIGKKLEVYTMFYDQGTPGVVCGTAVEFITNSTNTAVPCYNLPLTYDVGTFKNMTVDFRRNKSPYLSTYCVRLTLTYCQSDQYQCDDGSCIPKSEVCDNIGQCPDDDDELNCGGSCSEDQILCDDRITCYDPALRCDGTPQCPDGSDETSCAATTPLITISCEESAYFPTTTTTTSTTTTPTTTTTTPTTSTTLTTTTTPTTTTTMPSTTQTTTTTTATTTTTHTTATTPTTTTTTPTISSTTIKTTTLKTTTKSTVTTPITTTSTPTTKTTTPTTVTTTQSTSTEASTASSTMPTTTTTTIPLVFTTTTKTPSSSSTVSTSTPAPTTTSAHTTAEPTTLSQSSTSSSQPAPTTTAAVPSPTTQRKSATTEEDDDDDNKVLIVGIVSGVLALILLIVCIVFWIRSKDWSTKGKGEVSMKRFSPEGEEPPTHAWYPADGEPSYTVNTMYVRDDTINIQDVYDAEAKNEPVYSYPKKKKKEFMLYSL